MAEVVLSGVIMGACACLMVGIGIFQMRSAKPVGFYTGEKAPDEKEISDVKAWNHKHGIMWILYGISIMLGWASGLVLGDSLLLLIPFSVCLLLPIPVMMRYHHKLVLTYFIRK